MAKQMNSTISHPEMGQSRLVSLSLIIQFDFFFVLLVFCCPFSIVRDAGEEEKPTNFHTGPLTFSIDDRRTNLVIDNERVSAIHRSRFSMNIV